jgi:hypothetical protein
MDLQLIGLILLFGLIILLSSMLGSYLYLKSKTQTGGQRNVCPTPTPNITCPTLSPNTPCPSCQNENVICAPQQICSPLGPCPTPEQVYCNNLCVCPLVNCSPIVPCPSPPVCSPIAPCPGAPSCSICRKPVYKFYFPGKSKCLDSGDIWRNGYGDYTCESNNLSQIFYLNYLDNNTFQIQKDNGSNARCLSAANSRWDFTNCDSNQNNQKFKWNYTGDNRTIQSLSSSNCLDIGNVNKNAGCSNSNENQRVGLLGTGTSI